MGLAIVFVLALLAAALIAYPLLPGRTPAPEAPAVTDADIEQAVRGLRQSRGRRGLFCPACGQGYQAGDGFCVRCGSALPDAEAVEQKLACPSCGAAIRKGDRFCAKCGHVLSAEEGA